MKFNFRFYEFFDLDFGFLNFKKSEFKNPNSKFKNKNQNENLKPKNSNSKNFDEYELNTIFYHLYEIN